MKLMILLQTKKAGVVPGFFCETEKILSVAHKLLSEAEKIVSASEKIISALRKIFSTMEMISLVTATEV